LKKSKLDLFKRIVFILEKSKVEVVRHVNSSMILAYWQIGKEIVEEIQKGSNRAEYGKQVLEELSFKLNAQYGKGFSVSNLKYFRAFFLLYSDRLPEIRHKPCGESVKPSKRHKPCDVLEEINKSIESSLNGFSSALS